MSGGRRACLAAVRTSSVLRWASVLFVGLMVLGCAGADLARRARGLRGTLEEVRARGAYNCAPRELALAEAHVEFAERELDQGEYFRAQTHLETAERNGERALALSVAQRCASVPRPSKLPPVRDGDRDGVADVVDRCPTDPEDRDAFQDEDGCPDPDDDRDGLLDASDECPREGEDRDGHQDRDGCPDLDDDVDGVADLADRCPRAPEDRDGWQDDDGCPDTDDDGDGLLDGADRCPRAAGSRADGGCPPRYTLIEVTKDKIELKQTIFFESGKPVLMSRSFPLLDQVAAALESRPALNVRVEGHTDSRGTRDMNVKLSQARADAVKAYIVGHGVDPGRLEAKGFGPDQPLATNKTAAGREKNRRVEFVITDR